MKIQFFRSLYFILKKGHRHNFTYHNSSYVFIFSLAFFFFCSWFSWFWWIQNCLVKLFQLFYLAMKSVHLPGCVVQNDIWHLKIENKNNNKKNWHFLTEIKNSWILPEFGKLQFCPWVLLWILCHVPFADDRKKHKVQ